MWDAPQELTGGLQTGSTLELSPVFLSTSVPNNILHISAFLWMVYVFVREGRVYLKVNRLDRTACGAVELPNLCFRLLLLHSFKHSFNGQLVRTKTTIYRQPQTIQMYWMNTTLSQYPSCLPWEDENQMKLLRFLAGGTSFLHKEWMKWVWICILKYNKGTQLLWESQYQFLNFYWDTINNVLQAY